MIELTCLWKAMQDAEHKYMKAKRQKTPCRHLLNTFKCKQDIFDKYCKRKKRGYQRRKCLELENVSTSDPNAFGIISSVLAQVKKSQIPW